MLTPTKLLQINPNVIPEVQPHHLDDVDLRKRAKFLRKCKELMWRCWSRDYVRGLRERHRQEKGEQGTHPNHGDAAIIGSEEKNRNLWKLGIVEGLIRGCDGVVRGAKVKTVNGQLERVVQHLYPLELSCDREPPVSFNPTAPTFNPRPRRDAAAAATVCVTRSRRRLVTFILIFY